jgi:hypothetical protein
MGALEISPDLRHKARKALLREVRCMKLLLYFESARVQFLKFGLQTASAGVHLIRELVRYFQKLGRY